MSELLTHLTPADCEFLLSRDERLFKSRFTSASQSVSSPTGLWEAQLKFTNIKRAEANALIGRLWKLQGAVGSFRLYDWRHPQASGLGGTYNVTDYQQALPGYVSIQTSHPQNRVIAKAGDYVSIDGELKGVTEDVVTDGTGKASIYFEPFMREPVGLTSSVTFDSPTGLFRLAPGYKVPSRSSKKLVLSELVIDCIERVTI
ncbi:hypothetical protein L1D34_07295 [Vibrio mediterranei]|uniref:hypothetical protein n=1 Tax=Vibrio mediterranei TaxID=689 RepID=UPI001EFEAB2F|nr:hypothetical protein [Vibrio mediterranei]MCG9624644.1 hypothetical protein [Vibrio mediterranei]